jgi:predicted dehydrogenase
MVTVAVHNALHAPVTLDAARAGQHVVCEKPLCLTLEEADEMIDVCVRHGPGGRVTWLRPEHRPAVEAA